ncbi:ligand-binding sensor domain-containing protein [Agarilytica rhodophyticola]|uniref:ligand-binding sensor domain-containing protein n=1 Tax=Agarilytica rhodophyticola TaxID=1737490 RepID=UPI001319E38A|nr:ligand-binding sensor domain-containing diguanylate cyclase [Agarilytica rhodophyticola]
MHSELIKHGMCLTLQFLIYLFFLTISKSVQSHSFHNIQFQRVFEGNHTDNILGTINAITQDSDGFIWLGGTQGLARFDGAELKVYLADPSVSDSLSNNYVLDMLTDARGHLWIATGDGLNHFDPYLERFNVFRAQEGSSTTLPDNFITDLEMGDNNELFVATQKGVIIIDTATGKMRHTPVQGYVYRIYLDKHRKLWVAYRDRGLIRYNANDLTLEHIYKVRKTEKDHSGLCGNKILDVEMDQHNILWIATLGNGICQLDPATGYFTHLTDFAANTVWDLFLDNQSNMWIATDHSGLAIYPSSEEKFLYYGYDIHKPKSLPTNNIRDLFQDRMGDIWISTFPGGLNYFDQSTTAFTNYMHHPMQENTLTSSEIIDIMQDDKGRVWLGTERGLNQLHNDTEVVTRINWPGLEDETVLSLEQGQDNTLWVGTWSHGLKRVNLLTKEIKTYLPEPDNPNSISGKFIWKVYRDSDNKIWVGTEAGGLNLYDPTTDSFQRFINSPAVPNSISANYVKTVLEDKAGNFWVATTGGLDRLDRSTGIFTHYQPDKRDQHSVGGRRIIALFEDSLNRIWVGTQEAGVSIFNPKTEKFITLNMESGLPSLNITSILESADGYIWLATTRGLARVDPKQFTIQTFNSGHGLVGSNFYRDASLLSDSGMLYFGSTTGLSVFDPSNISIDTAPPIIGLTDFKIANKSVVIGQPDSPLSSSLNKSETIYITPTDVMFSINFSALSYRAYDQNTYAYMLEGFDKEWIYTGTNRTATYTNLPAGKFVFRVKAANAYGIWNEEGIAINIVRIPEIWRTWWAYLAYTIGVICLFALYRHHNEIRRRSEVYREQSLTDSLTGIPNRAGIIQIAGKWLVGNRASDNVSLMLLDIDHFKKINDSHGHDAGDRILCEVAEVLRSRLRHDDHIGRWGGEEFLFICKGSSPEKVSRLAETLRLKVAEHIFDNHKTQLNITISIGVVKILGNESFEKAIKRADEALYRAKGAGRNRVVSA